VDAPIPDRIVQYNVSGPSPRVHVKPLLPGPIHGVLPGVGCLIPLVSLFHPWIVLKPAGVILAVPICVVGPVLSNRSLVALLTPIGDSGVKLIGGIGRTANLACFCHGPTVQGHNGIVNNIPLERN